MIGTLSLLPTVVYLRDPLVVFMQAAAGMRGGIRPGLSSLEDGLTSIIVR